MISPSVLSKILLALLAMGTISTHLIANTNSGTSVESISDNIPKAYLDCSNCDYDYLNREIPFVNFVRDRKLSDIHILVTQQRNASGGREYMVEFIGLNESSGMVDTLIFNTISSDTEDNVRAIMVKYIKLGLIRYVAKTNLAEHFQITFTKPTQPVEITDKWNKWIFEISTNVWANGGEANSDLSMWGNIEARRVVEETKIYFGVWGNYSESKNSFGNVKSTTIRRSKGTNGEFVFAINDKWSYDFDYSAFASIRNNKELDLATEVGIEYNIHPYSESSRKSWIFRSKLGMTYMDYINPTIFDKNNDFFTFTRLISKIELTQPWGSIDASISGTFYFHDFTKHRITLSAGTSVRVFEGFSVNMNGNYSRVRDQFYLPRGGATDEDILLRRIELASGYDYWVSFGVSYSFGSIYSSIVNTRF